ELADGKIADRASFFAAASRGAARDAWLAGAVAVLLDVPISSDAERRFVHAVCGRTSSALITLASGDRTTLRALRDLAAVEDIDGGGAGGLDRVRQYLFADETVPLGDPFEAVELFSAPGESREAVEVARRVLREAADGVRF